MKKSMIKVPRDIRFISDWEEFKFLNHTHILNKGITGCGLTQYCITNLENVILCSPRKMLLENKYNQFKNSVYLVVNEFDSTVDIDKDLTEKPKVKQYNLADRVIQAVEGDKVDPAELERKRINKLNIIQEITNYVAHCQLKNIPCKILVTYDSFRIVKEALIGVNALEMFRVVVDEFQSIFTDSKFKADTEMEFIDHLSDIDKVCFVSATPMIDSYLNQLDEFKNLEYVELDWTFENPSRTIKPFIEVFPASRGINERANLIIQSYLSGNFDRGIRYNPILKENEEVISKEAILYVNSIKNITDIIRKNLLKPEQVNILCSNTTANQEKIDKALKPLKSKYPIGSVPLRGQKNKMFTFCTRTVYLGADFYSDNARTFIFSDANLDCLAVDITLDLPQIMGRQRDINNPWKNIATLYVRLLGDSRLTKDYFERYVDKKVVATTQLLTTHKNAPDEGTKLALARKYLKDPSNYRDDYVGFNKHKSKTLVPQFNKLVMLAEQRAFEIQQIDYADRFTVINSINNYATVQDNELIFRFLMEFNKDKNFERRMKLLCDNCNLPESILNIIFTQIPLDFKTFYIVLGPEKIKGWNYIKARLVRAYDKLNNMITTDSNTTSEKNSLIQEKIYAKFKEGDIILMSQLKQDLKEIYESCGNKNTARATDISEFFNITKTRLTVVVDNVKAVKAAFKLIKKLK